ncbi:MAG: aminotransferase class I/II-fold pyridoxal phosphate-dependent enzyme [Actinomycetota bacterium]|nr:aminotransferase class I/II-fold pyridoxal phosphate-dependent enzyme [Actinomycetota bacterium]
MPDPALLPPMNAALAEVAGPSLRWTTSYLDNPLLTSLEEILREDWPFEPQRMGLVDGALDGLARVVEQVVHLGDRVAIENPGFPALMDLLESNGAEVIPLDMDELGVTVDSLESAVRQQPVAVFTHPRAQNPTGASMSEARVRDLAEVMRSSSAWIVEADHSGAIASGADLSLGTYLPNRTLRIRSYSKSHGPDLRIAAIGGAADLIDPLMARRVLGPGWTSRILQGVLVKLLTSPEAISSVKLARETYQRRSLDFRMAMKASGIQVSPGDGINVWIRVRDERSALITLAAAGIQVAPGGPFMVTASASSHLRVTVGLLPDEDSEKARIFAIFAVAAQAQPSVRGGIS